MSTAGRGDTRIRCCLCPEVFDRIAEFRTHADSVHGGQFHDHPGGRCSGCNLLIMPADLLPERNT